ncbi:MAG: peptidoglycan DD-metalloendopeptidase family protein [Bacteroidales bacterium]|nr:peptidoglycan DD-metalloendopeptidase family protein [Bacteroidales bacterium]
MISIFFSIQLQAQDRKELEIKRKKTQKEIEYTNSLIKKTRLEKKNSMNQLLVLNKKISAREELINNMQSEIQYLDSRINILNIKLDSLEKDLIQLKHAYAQMIVFAYKTRSAYDKLIFVLSAENFNKSYRRLRYLQYYGEYRQKQITHIINTKTEMKNILLQLKEKKNQKEQLKSETEKEKLELSKDKEEQTKILSNLKKQESELLKKLNEQKKADKQLQESIKRLIAEEMRKAREEAERKAKALAEQRAKENAKNKNNKTETNVANKTTSTNENKSTHTELLLTPEEQLLNDKFEANRGKLPWPTERGVILSSYGEHEHAVLKGVKVRNDGVYISTLPNAKVRSIFDGEVSKVLAIPGKNKIVLIKHGNYFTVYANLSDVFVQPGQKVKTKQNIGTASTDLDEDKTYVELQIWNGNIKLNPELWIAHSN